MRNIFKILIVCTVFINACKQPNSNSENLEKHTNIISSQTPADVHLGLRMAGMHHFFTKAGFSMQAGNYVLAQFYATEMIEEANDIVKLNVVEDTIHISDLMKTLLLPSLNSFKSSISGSSISAIKEAYQNLINNCNSCHVASNHSYIVVQEPNSNSPSGQQFVPLQLPQ